MMSWHLKQHFSYALSLLVVITCGVLMPGCQTPGNANLTASPVSGGLFRPPGAPWSILCLEISGDYRIEQIEQIADILRRTKGIRSKDVVVQNETDGFARLYYGKYYRKTDAKTGKRSTPKKMAADLIFLRSLADNQGKYFFLRARKVRYPTPHAGPAEWDLRHAEGTYSLQVGVFEPTDEFYECKIAAAQFCKLLRDRGFEAYYYHTEAGSMVTVGLFGEDAVIAQPSGLPRYSQEVLSLQSADDLLKYNRLNGAVYKATSDRGIKLPVTSRLVHLPQAGEIWR